MTLNLSILNTLFNIVHIILSFKFPNLSIQQLSIQAMKLSKQLTHTIEKVKPEIQMN